MTYVERIDNFIAGLDAETYRVGGSVRDELLGRKVNDADYMVRGVGLEELRRRIRKLRPDSCTALKLRDGRQVGWRVHKKGLGIIEICLPRTEVSTGPGRQDFEIVVDPSLTLADDACRRDFTFNALYLELRADTSDLPIRQRVSDPTGRGLYDLERRMVNTTHPSSFRDDPLRTLRALRFVSVLGYDLGVECEIQMTAHADAVDGLTEKGVSGTALTELQKLLMGADPAKALRIARDTGVLVVLLPELEPMLGFDQQSRYHDLPVCEHTFKALEVAAHVDAPLRVRMALLFHDAGKPESAWRDEKGNLHFYSKRLGLGASRPGGVTHAWAPEHVQKRDAVVTEDHEVISDRLWRSAAARLNVPRELRNDVSTLVLNHMRRVRDKGPQVARARIEFGDDLLRDLLMHRVCDACGKDGKPDAREFAEIRGAEEARVAAQKARVPVSVKDLAITGFDAAEAGLEGPQIGRALRGVLDEVVCDPFGIKLTAEWQRSALRRNA